MAGLKNFLALLTSSTNNAQNNTNLPSLSLSPTSPLPTNEEDAQDEDLDGAAALNEDDLAAYAASNKGHGKCKGSRSKTYAQRFGKKVHLGFAMTVEGVKLLKGAEKSEDEGVRKHLRKLERRLRRRGVIEKDNKGDFWEKDLEEEQEIFLEEEQERLMGRAFEESEGSEAEELEKELFGGEDEDEVDALEMFREAGFDVTSPHIPQQPSTKDQAAAPVAKEQNGTTARTMRPAMDIRGTTTKEKTSAAQPVIATSSSGQAGITPAAVTEVIHPTQKVDRSKPLEPSTTSEKHATQVQAMEIPDDMPASDDTSKDAPSDIVPEIVSDVEEEVELVEEDNSDVEEDSDDDSDNGNDYFVVNAPIADANPVSSTDGTWFLYHHKRAMTKLANIEWSEKDIGLVRLVCAEDGSTVVVISGRSASAATEEEGVGIEPTEGSNDTSTDDGGIRGKCFEGMPGYALETVTGPNSIAATVESLDFVNGSVAMMLSCKPSGEVTAVLTGIQKGFMQADKTSNPMEITFDMAHALDQVQWALSLVLKQRYVPPPQPVEVENDDEESESECKEPDFDPEDFEPEVRETLAAMNARCAERPRPQRKSKNKKRKRGDDDTSNDDHSDDHPDSGDESDSEDEEVVVKKAPATKRQRTSTATLAAKSNGEDEGIASEFPQPTTGYPPTPPSGTSAAPAEPQKTPAERKRKRGNEEVTGAASATGERATGEAERPVKKPRASKAATMKQAGDGTTPTEANTGVAPKKRKYNRARQAPAAEQTVDGEKAVGAEKPKSKNARKPKATAESRTPSSTNNTAQTTNGTNEAGSNVYIDNGELLLPSIQAPVKTPKKRAALKKSLPKSRAEGTSAGTNEAGPIDAGTAAHLTASNGQKRKRCAENDGDDQLTAGMMPQPAQRKQRAPATKKAKA